MRASSRAVNKNDAPSCARGAGATVVHEHAAFATCCSGMLLGVIAAQLQNICDFAPRSRDGASNTLPIFSIDADKAKRLANTSPAAP